MPFPQMQGLPEGASITGLLDYDIHKIEWNKYELKSGVTVCFLGMPQIFTTNKLNPNGIPVYCVTWNSQTRVVASEKETGNSTMTNTPVDWTKLQSTLEETLTNSEPWNEYYLKDGHTLRARSVVTQIRRITGQFDQTNLPIFAVIAQQIVDVVPTERSKNFSEA